MYTMKRETLTKSIAKTLKKAGYRVYTDRRAARKAPCCLLTPESLADKRLPMGRIERRSRFSVKYYPEPVAEAIGFRPCETAETEILPPGLPHLLELVKTPDGAVRGRGIECALKDGVAVITVTYTEWLRETEGRKALMRELETRFEGR